ncbi:hypothetical protein KPG71_06560 [Roseovarius sp. PS-C2]|uniref:hypothetical protein n=1 Tax=Roseovarius sp. PS-C2 TaxID=2820814 RepID=UPI001C0E05D0|nr:hypothetical protein [Roseovarius sp. PS-C2]MBU3259671.1 hypothetical protein [Roseovarius sp. PS-C2]
MSTRANRFSVIIVTDDRAVMLDGVPDIPDAPARMVIFGHGSGSNRMSPRNISVARQLNAAGIATLLFDLLTDAETASPRHVGDIALLANRVQQALDWTAINTQTAPLPKGLFGAGTGAAAAPDMVGRHSVEWFTTHLRGSR